MYVFILAHGLNKENLNLNLIMVYLLPVSTTIYLSNEPGKKWCVKSYMNDET